MSNQKHIDKLFEEKLKNFEADPSPEMWDAIASKLQRKKRRVIPLWWWYGSIAAVLILGLVWYFTLTDQNSLMPSTTEPIIVNSPETITPATPIEQVITQKSSTTQDKKNTSSKTQTKHIKKNNTVLVAENKANLVSEKNAEKDSTSAGKLLEDTLPVDVGVVQKNATSTTNTKEKIIVKDSTQTVWKPKKDFMAQVQLKDSIQQSKKNDKKWAVTPVVAIVRSNSFSKSSPIDKSLAAMPTNGANSFSYGVKISYQLNNKWAIQSGIHQQNIDYLTRNLAIVSNVSGGNLRNIDYSDVGHNFSIEANTFSNALNAGVGILTNAASLNQNYGYIEIPIEIKYTLIENKRFNTKIVAGMSSLFLNKNTISVTSTTTAISLGKANNLNTINFSSNFGLDLDYSFHEKWKLHINPMFKVHLNTFSKNSNGFRPYSLGVYTGIKYHF